MEDLHATFSDKLTVDEGDPQLHLKLDWSLRNKLIKKLNEHSQFGLLTKDENRMKTMDENNRIIASLDSLPVLIEDDGEQSTINQEALRFLKEVDYIKIRLGVFDAKRIHIVIWFKRFEALTEMLGWSNEQRVDGLAHLLGPGLDRIVHEKDPKYDIIKSDTIDLVNQLLNQSSYTRMFDHLTQVVIPIFEGKEFTNPEKRFWLESIASPQYFREFCGKLQDYGLDLKVIRLIESDKPVDQSDSQLYLKLDFPLKNKLVRKLNEQKCADRMKSMDENSEIIACLNSLPFLIEEELDMNENALKFFKGIEFMKLKLGLFDVRKHNIVGWFKRFEFYSDLLKWSGEQRVEGLVHLLENGLDRLACLEEPKYDMVKKNVIKLVTMLVGKSSDYTNHISDVSITFDKNKFTTTERTYWLGCVTSASYLTEFVNYFYPTRHYDHITDLLALI